MVGHHLSRSRKLEFSVKKLMRRTHCQYSDYPFDSVCGREQDQRPCHKAKSFFIPHQNRTVLGNWTVNGLWWSKAITLWSAVSKFKLIKEQKRLFFGNKQKGLFGQTVLVLNTLLNLGNPLTSNSLKVSPEIGTFHAHFQAFECKKDNSEETVKA